MDTQFENGAVERHCVDSQSFSSDSNRYEQKLDLDWQSKQGFILGLLLLY